MSALKFLIVALLVPAVFSYKYTYNNELLKLGHLEYRRVGMYSLLDAPAVGPPSDGHSFIHLDVTMNRKTDMPDYAGILQVLLAHARTFDGVGYVDEFNTRHFCCTQELMENATPGCTYDRLGRAIVSDLTIPPIQVHNVIWNQDSMSVQVNHQFAIDTTGRYYLLFSSCLNSTGDVEMTGEIVWINPYGYLPGELYHFIPLFYWLSIGYLALGLVWGLLCILYRNDLLHLQHYVSIVIVLGLLETAVWYFDYVSFNDKGTRAIGPVVVGVVLSSVKRTLSRLLVLIVCMGYGVMKPTLTQDQKNKVALLGFVYFVFSSVYDVMSSYSQMTYIMQHIRAFFLFPVAALDSLFFLWILQEISMNIQILSSRQQATKLLVYRRFWQILVATGVFSVLWAAYQIYVTMTIDEDDRWESLWMFEGMWHIVYFVVLCVIAGLWRPSTHTADYAFAEQITATEDDIDHTDFQATRSSVKSIEPAFVVDGDGSDDDHN
eukprot:c15141_g1_i1.p1 GENE.c15141_g1_i1~~c15141_g1_i1.p1  ORF type:complete len:507 (+),score=100.24 c15141_g1_i1:51-1523(+)